MLYGGNVINNSLWVGSIDDIDRCSLDMALVVNDQEISFEDARKFSRFAKSSLKTIILYAKGVNSLPNLLCMGASDLVYIDKDAEFCIRETELRRIDSSSMRILSSFINRFVVIDMIYTGRIIGTKEAVDLGMANAVSPIIDIKEKFEKLSSNIPFALKLLKKVSDINSRIDEKDARFVERMAFALTFCSKDQKEGMNAFVEKRKPKFKGK